jgi:CRP-like cAMP-binding protein/uncharacterized membrane protein
MRDLQATLAALSIFKALDPGELAYIAEQLQSISIAGGSTLISEGDQADDMFVVVSGRLGVFKRNADGKLELIDQVEAGAIIGEMALLSNQPRHATVVALRDTELVRFSKYLFEELANRSPKLMRIIADTMAMRLRNWIRPRTVNSTDHIDGGPRAARGIFCRTGEYWTVVYGDEECLIQHGKGLYYIAYLLRHAGRDIYALELVRTAVPYRGSNVDAKLLLEASIDEECLPQPIPNKPGCSWLGDAGEMLDTKAKQAYRRRLTELREELCEANQRCDEARAMKAEEEIAALTHELSRAVGLAGRDRRSGSAVERARVNVTRSIKLGLERIAQSSPQLGIHLKARIKTGTFCCYRPDPDLSIQWRV